MKSRLYVTLSALGAIWIPNIALAHPTVVGPATAGASYEAPFNIGHGCEGTDTYRLRVQIPAGVTSVRPVDNIFGKAKIEKDGDRVTAVSWTRTSTAEVKGEDTHFHKFIIRMRLPSQPFATVYFPATQTCRAADGTETTVEWTATEGEHGGHDSGGEGGPSPAPALVLLPTRFPGWNKFNAPHHIHDLTVFKDAEIVWAGDAAYSPNPTIQALIAAEPGVEVLEEIHPDTEIWVKY